MNDTPDDAPPAPRVGGGNLRIRDSRGRWVRSQTHLAPKTVFDDGIFEGATPPPALPPVPPLPKSDSSPESIFSAALPDEQAPIAAATDVVAPPPARDLEPGPAVKPDAGRRQPQLPRLPALPSLPSLPRLPRLSLPTRMPRLPWIVGAGLLIVGAAMLAREFGGSNARPPAVVAPAQPPTAVVPPASAPANPTAKAAPAALRQAAKPAGATNANRPAAPPAPVPASVPARAAAPAPGATAQGQGAGAAAAVPSPRAPIAPAPKIPVAATAPVATPDDVDEEGSFTLAEEHLRRGDHKRAEALYRRILDTGTQKGRAALALGDLFAGKDDFDRAQEFYRTSQRLFQDTSPPASTP